MANLRPRVEFQEGESKSMPGPWILRSYVRDVVEYIMQVVLTCGAARRKTPAGCCDNTFPKSTDFPVYTHSD